MLKYAKAFSGFSVNDLQAARNFYTNVLELEVTDNAMGLIELSTQGNNNILIYAKPTHEPATFTVLNFAVDDIDAAVDTLIEKGIVFEQYDGQLQTDEKGICRSPVGPFIAWFKDPAGNILSILQNKSFRP